MWPLGCAGGNTSSAHAIQRAGLLTPMGMPTRGIPRMVSPALIATVNDT